MSKFKELVEKRAAAFKAATELNSKDVALTADEKAKFNTLMTEVNSIGTEIEEQKKFDAVQKELNSVDYRESADNNPKGQKEQRSSEEQRKFESNAFYKYVTQGRSALTSEEAVLMPTERRTAEGTGLGVGGDLIPPYFQRDLEVAMKYFAPFTEYAEIVDTPDGAPMTWPVSSTVTRECQLVAEGGSVTDLDIGTGRTTFGAYKFGDLVKVGLEISQDSFTSVDGLVTNAFAMSFGRGLTHKFTTGSGTGEPFGIVTAATAGPISVGDDNQTTPDPTTQIGYYDLLALLHSIDPAYRNQPQAKWMFTDNTLLAIQRLKDKFGRPLWQPSLTSEAPDRILGKPYVINPYMDEIGDPGSPPVGNKPVLFGDLSRYKVRRVKTMAVQRLVERYAEFGQVGIIAWARYDGNLLDAGMHPVKYLICG